MLRFLAVFIDLAAFAAQCSVYFVVTSTQYTAFLSKPLATTTTPAPAADEPSGLDSMDTALSNTIKSTADTLEQVQLRFGWEAPIALFCVSIVWWENYVDRDIKLGKLNIPLGTYKRHLQSVRSKANIGASIWKIALTIAFSFLLLPREHFDNVFVSVANNPAGGLSAGSAIHSGTDMNNFDAGANQFDMGSADVPVRHRRQMPFPADDNNTVMGKIGGQEQLNLFANGEEDPSMSADPFDFVPDKVRRTHTHRNTHVSLVCRRRRSTTTGIPWARSFR